MIKNADGSWAKNKAEEILEGRDVANKYLSVLTNADQRTIESYLWFGARIVVIIPGEERRGFVVLVHETHGGRAQHQADRLNSGLHGTIVHNSLGEAVEHLYDVVTD